MSLPTSAAFRRAYMDGNAPLVKAVLHLSDKSTVEVGGDRIGLGGVSVTGATSPSGNFSIGAAIVGEATVTLANYDGWLDQLDLEDARVLVYAGANVGASEPEWALLGTYDVVTPETRGRTYPLQCRDYMSRFEVPYSDVATTYPASLLSIVSDICAHVGVQLARTDFTNASYVVQSRPTDELSCIDMVGFVAQLSCSFAIMTPEGLLRFGWYDPRAFDGTESWLDGGTFAGSATPYADGDKASGGGFMYGGAEASGGSFTNVAGYASVSAIRSLVTGTDDITITGLRVKAMDEVTDSGDGAKGETYLYGTSGYELSIESNPLIPYGTARAVADMVAPYVVGLTFRTSDADVIGDPSLQAGDAMVLTDRFGNTYHSYVTQATWNSGGSQRLTCEAVAPSRKAMAGRTGAMTRAISRVADSVRRAGATAASAVRVAGEAVAVANAINQHFWVADDGVHVTQATQEAWEADHEGPNILINSLGQLLRIGLSNMVSLTQGATAFYDGLGNLADNIVAQFGRDGAFQYVGGKLRSALTANGLNIFGSDGETSIAQFGASSRVGREDGGHIDVDDNGLVIYCYGTQPYSTIGTDNDPVSGLAYVTVTGECTSISESGSGGTITYVGIFAYADPIVDVVSAELNGQETTVIPHGSSFECPSASVGDTLTVEYRTSAIVGHASFGFLSSATGEDALASGSYSRAYGPYSQAFGTSEAYGVSAHAEGSSTARGSHSHSEGWQTVADGDYSHASGSNTVASSGSQTAIGKYNVEDADNVYALIVGNGTSPSDRSNAFAVTWGGEIVANDGRAQFGGNGSYLYLRDSSGDIWRIEKLTRDVQGYIDGTWRSLYFSTTQSRAANVVLAAPNGSAGEASFRALVHADMPKSGWAYLYGSASAASYVRMRVVSGLVWIQANIASGLTITANGVRVNSTAIGEDYWPDREVTAPIYHSSNNTGCMWMDTSGHLHMSTKASSSQTTAYGELVYPIG